MRTTTVNTLNVNSASFSSIVQLGDAHRADPYTRALALQREIPIFDTNSFPFSDYAIFTRPYLEMATSPPMIQEHIHHDPSLFVHWIRVGSMSSSAIVQVGNLEELDAKSRIKHIRIIVEEDEDTNSE
ncbi:spore germination protein GerPE [Salirhabdus sp. Marseille-P4669]|uniref:spore germination protein GerPE n=1 Tax=Salirhabdus sp. Marseille-P4669 TaxID=2042310 RepID=UPI000C7AC1AC|nr:spore germination protein GerPE [Salirhabdus sp. Marseille-P4669]